MAPPDAVYTSVSAHDAAPEVAAVSSKSGRFGARHEQALLLFTSLAVGYSMRAQLGVSLVAMTAPPGGCSCADLHRNQTSDLADLNFTDVMRTCRQYCFDEWDTWTVYRTYNWSKSVLEMTMFSFFVGYTVMQIPMGILAQKFGGKITILVALLANGVLSILTPWLPLLGGWVALSSARLLQGATQAAFYPGMHSLLARWAPAAERGRLSTYTYTGSQVGTIIGFQMAGVFAGSPSLGWPVTFWACGVLSLFCSALLWWRGAAAPHLHRAISRTELAYIQHDGTADAHNTSSPPWRAMLSCPAVWALFVTHAGSAFGFVLVLTQLPLYVAHVLQLRVTQSGLLCSLPYACMCVAALTCGRAADAVRARRLLSLTNTRRLANTLGTVGSALVLVWFSSVRSPVAAAVLLATGMALHAAVHVSFHINQIDLAPNYAGSLMAMGNMLAMLVSLLVPALVTAVLRDDLGNQGRWQVLFLVVLALQVVTNITFVVLVRTDVQPWNQRRDEKEMMNVAEKSAMLAAEQKHQP